MPRSTSANPFEEYDPQSQIIRDARSLSRSVAPQRSIQEQEEEAAQREAERTGVYQAPEEKRQEGEKFDPVSFVEVYQTHKRDKDLHELAMDVVDMANNLESSDDISGMVKQLYQNSDRLRNSQGFGQLLTNLTNTLKDIRRETYRKGGLTRSAKALVQTWQNKVIRQLGSIVEKEREVLARSKSKSEEGPAVDASKPLTKIYRRKNEFKTFKSNIGKLAVLAEVKLGTRNRATQYESIAFATYRNLKIVFNKYIDTTRGI